MKPSGITFVISGGCSGLGLATALALHGAGAYVSLLDLHAENGAKIVKQLNGLRVKFFETDVSDTKSVEAAVNGTVAWIKETGKPLAGVVPAAGVGSAAKVCISFYLHLYTCTNKRTADL
jgi:NAD(P)-dependent dehydrogenase (short-subunit alcohol dehydrogenase family)